jgi:outer membrane protein assembly factor BamB
MYLMKKLITLILLMLLVDLTTAAGNKYVTPNSVPLISPELIAESEWTHNWQLNLPLKKKEKIEEMGVLGPDLFVMTDSNVLFCIDREKGKVRFTTQLSASRLPIHKPFYYDEKFWFMVGNEMLVFDPAVGDITIRETFQQIGSSAESGLARNETHIYISGSNNRLHAINVDGYWQQFIATADNDSPIVSIAATDEIVVFATQAGNIVGMTPDKAQKLWQFDATGNIKGQIVLDGDHVYIGSFDSKLYKLGLESGMLLWSTPFHSGAPIRDSFTVGKDVIYLYNTLNGLYGVDKNTGQSVWQVLSGEGMVCETNEKGFVFALPGILKAMDNKNGKELYSVNIAGVQRYAHNTTDAVMYLADEQGRITSITVK